MAPRKKKPKGDPLVEKIEELKDFAEIAAADLPPDVDKALAEIGEDVTRIILYRRLRGEKQAYVGTVDADEFSLDDVAKRWGGGRYLARLVGQDGIIKGMTFYIDESIRPQRHVDGERASSNGVTDQLLERLLDKLGSGSQKDPMEIAAALAAASAAQMQTLMAMVMPLLTNRGSGASPAELLQLIEFGADRFGGKEDGGIAGVVREVGIPLVNIAQEALARGQPHRPRLIPNTPAPPASSSPVSVPVTTTPGLPAWAAAVKPYIGQLLTFAQRGDDPAVWAGVIDVQYPRLARWLETAVTDEAFPPEFFRVFPELAPVKEWVLALFAEFVPEDFTPAPKPETKPTATGEDDEE